MVGRHDRGPPAHLTDWRGQSWTPESGTSAAHANARFCTPIEQCPILATEWDDPAGVPLDAIFFGGRRRDTVPLVVQARDWQHGVFLAATLSSETTAAASGHVGQVRRDPMAMLPFIGYNAGDYFAHWIEVGKSQDATKLPAIFYVNWFRRDAGGRFLWPGFGENIRVLKWALQRLSNQTTATDTPVGHTPTPDAVDTSGLDLSTADLAAALAVDPIEWLIEVPAIKGWLDTIGPQLPTTLHVELDALRQRLGVG